MTRQEGIETNGGDHAIMSHGCRCVVVSTGRNAPPRIPTKPPVHAKDDTSTASTAKTIFIWKAVKVSTSEKHQVRYYTNPPHPQDPKV